MVAKVRIPIPSTTMMQLLHYEGVGMTAWWLSSHLLLSWLMMIDHKVVFFSNYTFFCLTRDVTICKWSYGSQFTSAILYARASNVATRLNAPLRRCRCVGFFLGVEAGVVQLCAVDGQEQQMPVWPSSVAKIHRARVSHGMPHAAWIDRSRLYVGRPFVLHAHAVFSGPCHGAMAAVEALPLLSGCEKHNRTTVT